MLEKIKKLVSDNKDDELKALLEGLVTPQRVKEFLDTEDGKKLLQPILDKYHAKGLDTWKANNLEKIVEEEYQKRNPAETEEQKRLRKLEAELEREKKERVRETLKNKALSIATEKGLPIDLIDHFVGQDENATLESLTKLEKSWQSHTEKVVQDKFKADGRTPHKDKGEPKGTYTLDQIKGMSRDEIIANYDKVEASLAAQK
jgi:enoyl reductase-like protein